MSKTYAFFTWKQKKQFNSENIFDSFFKFILNRIKYKMASWHFNPICIIASVCERKIKKEREGDIDRERERESTS